MTISYKYSKKMPKNKAVAEGRDFRSPPSAVGSPSSAEPP